MRYYGRYARLRARAVTDDTAVDCRVRHSQGDEAVNAAPPCTHGGHQRRLRKQQRMRRSRQPRVPAFLDQAGVPAERLRQHAQVAGYRLDVTIPLAFPARLDAQQNAAPLFIKPPFDGRDHTALVVMPHRIKPPMP